MIKDCQDATDRWVYPFDDLIMDMFEAREDLVRLRALYAYILKYGSDYCLIHLSTLINCCRGYIKHAEINRL